MKILIVYASAGAGHKKAAEAVVEAFNKIPDSSNYEISIVDSLDFSNMLFKWLYGKQYLTLVNYFPHIWGFFYYLFDYKIVNRLLWLPRRIINAINCWKFEKFVCYKSPDLIISTHFMANEIISHMKKRGLIKARLFSAVTDYRLHSFWVTSGVDLYFVATQKTKEDLLLSGVPNGKIFVTGVPISPRFSLKQDKFQVREKIGIDKNLFTVLMIGGGFGVGPMEELVSNIGVISDKIQLLIVCGYNKELSERVAKIVSNLGIKAKIYGFANNVDELMSASDILVTKPGGLTTSEAMAKVLPAIFIKPIPGQETRNSAVLAGYKAAFVAKDTKSVTEKVKELFKNPESLDKMKAAIRSIASPNPAKNIVDLVVKNIS